MKIPGAEAPIAGRSKRRFIRETLGIFGILIIWGGSTITLAALAFLVFLWIGEGGDGGQRASILWRWILLNQHITQAITLSSVILRIIITAQASLYTSLIAAIVLEKHGVPLSHVAEISIIRVANDGPLKLAWLLVTSARKSKALAILNITLLLSTVAIQFSSTILVSDLTFSTLVDSPRAQVLPTYMTTDVISLNSQVNNWMGRPTAFVPFGEATAKIDPTPNDLGVSDTGIVKRVFLPLPQTARTTLRRYKGKGFGFDSRFVCMRPSVDPTLSIVVPAPFTSVIPFFLSIFGQISYKSTFAAAGLTLPPGCDGGSCFPSSFNCSLPQFQYATTQGRQGTTDSLCVPNGDNAEPSAKNSTLSDLSTPSYSEVFLFFRSNGTYDLWRGPDNLVLNGNFRLRNASYNGEWITYNRAIGGVTQDGDPLDDGFLHLEMSMCFQQVAFNLADTEVFTDHDLVEPTMPWDAAAKTWNTSAIRSLLGVQRNETASERGIFSVESVTNPQHINNTQYFTNKLINNLYNSPHISNTSLFMDTQGSGRSSFLPHVQYQAIFADTLNATNRPGVAMQATLTALSGSFINEAIPQFDATGNAITTSSTRVLAPRSLFGLLAVAGVVAVNLLCGIVATWSFLRETRYSSHGNYWHAVSQIVSEHTAWILQDSTQLTDGMVNERLAGVDPEVRIERSVRAGRVQVVMRGFKG